MTWVKVSSQPTRTNHCWRCPGHKGHKVWPRSGSFFEQSNLPLTKIVGLIFCWANDFPNKTTIRMVGVSERHVVEWYKVSSKDIWVYHYTVIILVSLSVIHF